MRMFMDEDSEKGSMDTQREISDLRNEVGRLQYVLEQLRVVDQVILLKT